jgi:hypothetical protein
MKKFIILLLLLVTSVSFALPPIGGRPNEKWWSDTTYQNPLWVWLQAANLLIETGTSTGTGSVFYVDSNVTTEGNGTSWDTAKDTLDEAINLCTASNGDVIYVAQGHAETVAAANGFDADVAGITIIGFGNGANAPTFTFSATASTVAVGAANVKIDNIRFLAGISEVVTGVSIEAAGDDCVIINCQFPEPATSTFEFDEAITVASGADRLTVAFCTAYSADATGATSFIDLTAGVNNGTTIVGNTIHGEYSVAPIISDKADLETYVVGNAITQLTASQFGIEFTAAATGLVADNRVNATVLFEVDPGSMAYYDNMEGDALPEGVSLNGQLGAFTGPAAGAAQDDNVKASLDLAHTDLDAILADTSSTSGIDYWQERTITATTDFTASTDDMFTVAGGAIKITSLFGKCTTLAGGSPGTMTIESDATAGADYDSDLSTTVSVDALGAGDSIRFTNAIDEGVLTLTANTGAGQPLSWFVDAGNIEQTLSSTGTGAVTWYMTYVPLETGVTVTAP